MAQDIPLPDGWTWTTIGEITLPIEKVFPQEKPNKRFTYIDISSIDNKIHKIVEPKVYLGVEAPSRARQLVRANDILFSTVRTYLENVALVPDIFDGQIASTGFAVLRTNHEVLPKLLFFYCLTNRFIEPLNELQRGTSYPAVRDGDVRVQPFPRPPLREQERIVAKIEELFTQLEAGTAALRRIQAGLKRYKAGVLKAACEGRLVPQDPSNEPAEELLRRLTYERRNKWQESQKLKGKKFDKIKYVEPAKPDFSELPELPKGWEWSKIDNICAYVTDGFHETPTPTPEGYPYVLATQIKPEGIDFNNSLYVSKIDHKRLFAKTRVKRNDILVVSIGAGSGIPAVVNVDFEFSFKNVAILKKLDSVDAKYFFYFLLQKRDELFHRITKGGAQPFLSLEVLREIPIPIPPLAEQHRIVTDVDRRLSVAAEVEAVVGVTLARSARLRKAILKRAFVGRLVAQNPKDEPAEVLLERMSAPDKTKVESTTKQARLF